MKKQTRRQKQRDGMRFVLFGSYPGGGGWDDYYYEFTSRDEAKMAAYHQLKKGCNAILLDQQTEECTTLTLKKGAA